MAHIGETIENPAMGATIRFRQVAESTDGALMEFDFFLNAGGVIAEDHLHPEQLESFQVIDGAVVGHVGGIARTLETGQDNTIQPGVVHGWRNAADGQTHLRVQFRPALKSAEFFETVFAIARAGRTDSAGVPFFPEKFAIVAAFPHEFKPAGMPKVVHVLVRAIFGPLSGRILSKYQGAAANSPR
jgi:quercetin dioxygenase-like cupin family protein